MTHPYFENTRHPRVLAHRGLADADVWENTAGALAAAHAAGAEYVETDCQLTASGDVVLFHDETLERLLGDPRRVDAVTTAELASLLAPHGGLMTVVEALAAFPRVRFNIDVKSDAAAEPLGAAIARDSHRVLVTSFSDARRRRAINAALRRGAECRPAASAGQSTILRLLVMSFFGLPTGGLLRDIDALQIPEKAGILRVFTRSLRRATRRHGVEIHVWTINEPADMTRLIRRGADGIVSDHADVALRTLNPR